MPYLICTSLLSIYSTVTLKHLRHKFLTYNFYIYSYSEIHTNDVHTCESITVFIVLNHFFIFTKKGQLMLVKASEDTRFQLFLASVFIILISLQLAWVWCLNFPWDWMLKFCFFIEIAAVVWVFYRDFHSPSEQNAQHIQNSNSLNFLIFNVVLFLSLGLLKLCLWIL